MKNKLFALTFIVGLFLGSNAFAIPNPFIYEEDVIQAQKIPGTDYGYCVSTVVGTFLQLLFAFLLLLLLKQKLQSKKQIF